MRFLQSPRQDLLRLPLLVRVGIPAELEVDAPDVVGLPVQQHRLVRVERRVEPEPALGREVRLHQDVGDQEAVAEHLPFRFESQHAAHGAARTVADDQPVAPERVGTVRRVDDELDVIALWRDRFDFFDFTFAFAKGVARALVGLVSGRAGAR